MSVFRVICTYTAHKVITILTHVRRHIFFSESAQQFVATCNDELQAIHYNVYASYVVHILIAATVN